MLKKIVVMVAILIAATMLMLYGIWISPYVVGVLHSDGVYVTILCVLLLLLLIVIIVFLCKKCLRIFSLLFIPHIISLIVLILFLISDYVAQDMGNGFVRVKSPFSRQIQIRTALGRVVFDDAWEIYQNRISGKTLFTKDYHNHTKIYDRDGGCILIRPSDDTWMEVARDAICTGKDITQDYNQDDEDNQEHIIRIRIFNLSGKYMATRIYTTKYHYSDYDWNLYSEGEEYLTEYIEEVVELEDGVKMFNTDDDKSYVTESSTPRVQSHEQIRAGHWKYIECPTCHGYGKHIMVECDRCRNGWQEPGFGPRDNGKPEMPGRICDKCNGNAHVTCSNFQIELKKYVYD
ncbi:MAG: hypothetical protein J1F13_02835 [Prevotellaceae bacterium]|nr:hypothetical protein [Prevotellaceae bacterium]